MKKILLVLALSAISCSVFAAPRMSTSATKSVVVLPVVTLSLPGFGAPRPAEAKTLALPGLGSLTIADHDGGKGSTYTLGVLATLGTP